MALGFRVEDNYALENLKAFEYERKPPNHGEVGIKTDYISLNFRDLLVVTGQYNSSYKLPLVPCTDMSGTVIELPPGHSDLRLGQTVVSTFHSEYHQRLLAHSRHKSSHGGPLDGFLLTEQNIRQENLIPFDPTKLHPMHACTLPCAALTGWNALYRVRSLKRKASVMVIGSGGVSNWALKIALRLGHDCYVITSDHQKGQKHLQTGVKKYHCVTPGSGDHWAQEAMNTFQTKMDLVIDTASASYTEQSASMLKENGEIAMIGILSGTTSTVHTLPIIMHSQRLRGVYVGTKKDLAELITFIEETRLQPAIEAEYHFQKTKEAFLHLKKCSTLGKIIIRNNLLPSKASNCE